MRLATWAALKRAITLPDRSPADQVQVSEHVKHLHIFLEYVAPGDGSVTDQQLDNEGEGWYHAYWQGWVRMWGDGGEELSGLYNDGPAGISFNSCSCHHGLQTLESALLNATEAIENVTAFHTRDQLAHYQEEFCRIFGHRNQLQRWWFLNHIRWIGVKHWLSSWWYDVTHREED